MRAHKAYVVQEPFGIDALTLAERPVPEPGAGQVLVVGILGILLLRDLGRITKSGAKGQERTQAI